MNLTDSNPHNEGTIFSLRNVLLLATAIRVLLPVIAFLSTGGNAVFTSRDTNSYVQPAISLISDGRFARWDEPDTHRTPGYPVFLIPGIASGYLEPVTIILQIAVSVLTVFLVYRITLILFERTDIAVLSAFLYAIEPLSILYSSKLLTETLFTALITLFLYFLLRYWKERSIIYLWLSAVALAAAAYVRPVAYYLPIPVLIILFVWMLTMKRDKARTLVHVCIFLLTAIGLIGIWQVRNNIETGYPSFSTAPDYSLYFWQGAAVRAAVEGIPFSEMREQMGYTDKEVYFRNFPDQRGWEQSDILRSMGKAGIDIILSNPGTYSVLVLKGMLRTLLDPGATDFLRMFRLYPEAGGLAELTADQGPVAALRFLLDEMPLVFWANILFGPLLVTYVLLAILGVIQSRKVVSMPMILLMTVTAYFLVLTAAGIGTSRARHPIMPIVCVLAGFGLYWIIGRVKNKWPARRAKLGPRNANLAR